VGRELAGENPQLAERARRGELPVLCWKGGVDRRIQAKKFGTFNYLAQWMGLRGEDLDIDLAVDRELKCSRTEMVVTFTSDDERWRRP